MDETHLDETQRLLAAATEYFAILDRGDPLSIDAYVASSAPSLRAELAALLAAAIDRGEALAIPEISLAERERAAIIAAAVRGRHLGQPSAQPQTLIGLRRSSGRSVAELARAIGVPVAALARIERGEVSAASIPARFISRLAAALGTADLALRAALPLRAAVPAGVRLLARSGTVQRAAPQVSFDAALRDAGASAAERAGWSE